MMDLQELTRTVTNIILFSSTVPLAIFIFRYVHHSPFGVHPEGRTLLLQKIAFLAVMLLVGLAIIDPNYLGRDFIRLAVYSSIVMLFWVDVVNLVRIQRRYPWTRTYRRTAVRK